MRAAVFEAIRTPFRVHSDWPDPDCGPRDAVIRVEANGICRSDWHVWVGDWDWLDFHLALPTVIGHEFSGVVEEVGGDVQAFRTGDRVVSPFQFPCGICDYCRSGFQNVCRDIEVAGFQYTGGYGRYAVVPRADLNLVRLPDAVSFVTAASMGCRFMTSFRALMDQAGVVAASG